MSREELIRMVQDFDEVSIFLTRQISGIANMAKVLDGIQVALKDVLKESETVVFPALQLVKKQSAGIVPIGVKKRGWPKGKLRGKRRPKMEVVL